MGILPSLRPHQAITGQRGDNYFHQKASEKQKAARKTTEAEPEAEKTFNEKNRQGQREETQTRRGGIRRDTNVTPGKDAKPKADA